MSRLTLLRRRARRVVLARRRLLAGSAAAVAVAAGLQAAADPPVPKTFVVTAARDLGSGTVVGAGDLRRVAFDPASVPSGVLREAEVVGRTTAAPVRAGEPITDVRLVSGSLLDAYPGMVAAPVRIGDPGAVALLEVGDVIDVLAADPRGSADAVLVADDAPVIALPRGSDTGLAQGGLVGALVVLAVPEETAQDVAAAGTRGFLSLVLEH